MPLKIQHTDDTSINLTPMIDIVFLLIIFFMVGTHFSQLNDAERDIALQVPTVSNAEALTAAPRKRIINVYRDGRIILDRQEVSLEELQQNLANARQQYQKLGVVVRGDGDGKYSNVARVITACQNAKISDLNIAVQPTQFR